MRYVITFLALTHLGSVLHGMKHEIDLTWEFNKARILQKQDPATITLCDACPEAQSSDTKAELQQTLLALYQSINVAYSDEDPLEPRIIIQLKKLQLMTQALDLITKRALERKAQSPQDIHEKAIFDAARAEESAKKAYTTFIHDFKCNSGSTGFWRDHGHDLHETLKTLQDAVNQTQNEAKLIDPEGKRFDATFKTKWRSHSEY